MALDIDEDEDQLSTSSDLDNTGAGGDIKLAQPPPFASRLGRMDPDKTAFQNGYVNFADAPQNSLVPSFVRPTRDLMSLDPDPDGSRTVKWGKRTGSHVGQDYIAGLTVFGRPMSHDQLASTVEGQELLAIAAKNRRGEQRGFFEAIKDVSWSDAPFVGMVAMIGGSAMSAYEAHETMRKLQNGEPVTDDELIKTRLYMAKSERDSAGSWGATVGDIVRQAPGFVTEFVLSGGIASAGRAAVAKTAVKGAVEAGVKVGEKATAAAVSTGMKKLTKELAEEGLEELAKKAVGQETSKKLAREGVRKFAAEMSEMQQKRLAVQVAHSLEDVLKKDLQRMYGEKAAYMYSDKVVKQMAKNLAIAEVKRSTARMAESNAFVRFSKGLFGFAKDHLTRGLMDHGMYGTPSSSVLFWKQNKAGRALADAIGILAIEAPVKGALQFGTVALARKGIMSAVNGGKYVTEAQLGLESQALMTGNKQLMDSAESLALGINFLEYASENSGAGFSALFRSAGLATGLSKQASRAFVGELGGVLKEANQTEAGGFLRGLIRKAVGSWEETAQRTAEARSTSVFSYLTREGKFSEVDRAFATRLAAGDMSQVVKPEMQRFIGDNLESFVKRAVKYETGRKTESKVYRSYLRYWAANKMVKNHWGPDELANAFKRMGYDGIIEEMMEERYTDFAKGLFGLDATGNTMMSPAAIAQALDNVKPGSDELPWDQLAAEAVGFSIPMLTRAVSMRVMRNIGGSPVIGQVRNVSHAAQRAKESMTSVERSVGDFRADHEATMTRLAAEEAKAKDELDAAKAAATAANLSEEDAKAATAAAQEAYDSVVKRKDAQTDAFKRIAKANGIEDIAAAEASQMLFVPVVSARTEKGDVEGDKLRVDRASDELADAYGYSAAATENAWMIGKAQFDAIYRNTEDPTIPWYRRWARKAVGITAAIITGEPALAMHNYARWAAVDEGLDPLLSASLLEQYKQDRQDAIDKIRGDEGHTSPEISEDEVWERMAPKYKAAASALMSSYLSLHNVSMFSQSDFRAHAVDHLARKAKFKYTDGAYERTEADGSTVRMTAEEFAESKTYKKEVDDLTADIAAATVRILTDRVDMDLGSNQFVHFFQIPTDAPDERARKERTALALAAQMAGFKGMYTSVRLGPGQTLEEAAEIFGMVVPTDAVDRIRDAALKPDGSVDYDAPAAEDIIAVASALRRDVRTGSDKELRQLRESVVDLVRQVGVISTGDTLSFSAPVKNFKDRRLYGAPYVDVTAHRRADGKWVATLDTAVTDENKTGKIDLVKDTEEEMTRAMEELGWTSRQQGLVITPTMVVASEDPIQVAQQLNIMREYRDKTAAPVDGVVDPRYMHPALRKNEDGEYVNKDQAAIDAQLRKEMLLAWMYDRFGEDVTRYSGVVTEEVQRKIEAKARELYGKHLERRAAELGSEHAALIDEERRMDAKLRASKWEYIKDEYNAWFSDYQRRDEANFMEWGRARDRLEDFRAGKEMPVPEEFTENAKQDVMAGERTAALKAARLAHEALYGERGYMKILNDMLRSRGVHTPLDGGVTGMLTGNTSYTVGLRHVRSVAGSAIQYVAVDFANGQSDSSAILHAVLDDAYVRYRRLVAGGGIYSNVVRDFMKYLYDRAEAMIYSADRVTKREQEALIAFRDDIASRFKHPTRQSFCELASAFALFMAEKDKSEGTTKSSPYSLAYQALSTSELYGSAQFLRFFALVDIMLGGSGFAYESAARKLKAGLPAPSGVARVMAAFGSNTEALSRFIEQLKPLGKTYAQFEEEVNRQAQTLNPRVQQTEKAVSPKSAEGLLAFIRDVMANAKFTEVKDARDAFNKLAAVDDRTLRAAFRNRLTDLQHVVASLEAAQEALQNQIRDLDNQLQKALQDKAAEEAVKNSLKTQLAELQKKLDPLNVAIEDGHERLLRQSSDKAGVTATEGDAVDSDETLKDGAPDSGSISQLPGLPDGMEAVAGGFGINIEELDELNGTFPGEQGDDSIPHRIVIADNVDFSTGTTVAEENGRLVVTEHDPAMIDMPKEDCMFGAAAIRSLVSSLTGSDEPLSFEEFRALLNRVGTFREYEAKRLHMFYKNQSLKASALRLERELSDEDNEGAKATNDQNFNDKLLALYEGKELNALLTMGTFVAPEEGRSLQGLLDNIRAIVKEQLGSAKPGTSLHDSLSKVDKLLNPRAVTEIHTKEYDELTQQIEELRKKSGGKDTEEIDALRLKRAQLFTVSQREAYWRMTVKELDVVGPDGVAVFDNVVRDLMSGEGKPVAGRAAFLLSFMRALDPATRTRLLSLCANSAVCAQAKVDIEMPGAPLTPVVGHNNAVSSRVISAAFAGLRILSVGDLKAAVGKMKAALAKAKFLTWEDAGDTLTTQMKALASNLRAVSDALAEVLGNENPLVRILRSDSLFSYMRTSKVFNPAAARTFEAIVSRCMARDKKYVKDLIPPELVNNLVQFLDAWLVERAALETAGAKQELVDDAFDRVSDAWFSWSAGDENAKIGHKQAMNSPIWKRLLETYASSRPVTVTSSVYIPGRSLSTSSKVVVSAPGVIPVIAQWMDRPITDKTSFAYIAKHYMMGATGDRLRAMSDADFMEQVYPECRQMMTWPDAQRTPILAKNLTRDFTPDYVHDRCAELFNRKFGSLKAKKGDEGYARAVTGAALRKKQVKVEYKADDGSTLEKYEETDALRVVRWFSPIYPGEHTSGALLQMPGLAYVEKDGNTGAESFVSFVKAGETFDEVSTRLNELMGLAKLGDDAKRAALTTAQVPAVAMRGCKIVDGHVVFGESRLHALLNFADEMAGTKQEALSGGVVGVGYGVEEQRRAASDPMSTVLKLHYMSTSGAELEMIKGLTLTASEGSAKSNGLASKDSVVRILQDHLLEFRKNDSDISNSIMTDRDGLKVSVLNSKVVGVPYVDKDGKPAKKKLLDYIMDKLRDVDIPDGGLSGAELDALLGDGKAAPEGANAEDYRPGTFDWSAPDLSGNMVDSRVTLSDLLGGNGVKVLPIDGLSGKAIDLSFVDNDLMSYTVANVSHDAEQSVGKAARNTMLDAATMAAVQLRGNLATGESARSARRVIDNFANWGLLTAALGADPRLVEDCRTGAGRSEKVEALIDGKGDHPHSLLVEDQLAYDVMKRVRDGLNLPLNKIDCVLASAGAVYDDKGKIVVSHVKDPFLRYAARGSRVFSKTARAGKYNGISRSLGWGQINVRSDGFRYVWHLDRKAFAEVFGAQYADASSDVIREKLDEVFTELRTLDSMLSEKVRYLQDAMRARSPDMKERAEAATKAQEAVRSMRERIAKCFVDHYGQRVSDMKVKYEHAKLAEKNAKLSRNYRDTVSFDDLFIANPKGNGRIFDRSAVHGADAALRLGKDAATRAQAAHMAQDADPVVLAGSTFGLPRTPSYNGSMWLQVLRASIYATTVEDEDGQVVECGTDAMVMPDAQSLKILGCDHDGDKSSCYMFHVNTVTGHSEIVDIPDAGDPDAGAVGAEGAVLSSFYKRPEVRRKYLERMVRAGLVASPSAGVRDGVSQNVYRLASGVKEKVSNAFVQGLFDLARNTVQESPDEERDFYGTHLARATHPQPVSGRADDPETKWGKLVALAGDAAQFLKGTTLANSVANAHVATSAMSSDRARGQIVSFVGMLHVAKLSGKFEDVLARGNLGKIDAWFDFIYGLDGISNATFDDIKEQICRRLGWTQGMIDTVVTDLIFSQDKVPTTEEEFLEILTEYVGSIASRGSRYYMMAASEPPEGNDDFTDVHVKAREFATGKDNVKYSTVVTVNAVLDRFHMMEYRDDSGERCYRLRPDCRSVEALAGVKDKKVRAILSHIVSLRTGLPASDPATDKEKRLCTALVRSMKNRGGETAGLGYVYYLASHYAEEGVPEVEMEKFLTWYEGTETLSAMREFASAVNYTKADPGDPGKLGKRNNLARAYDRKVNEEAPRGDLDAQLNTLHAAVRTIYEAGMLPVVARGALAANCRGQALARLASKMTDGYAKDSTRKMLSLFALAPAIPSYDALQLQANLLSDAFFISALRTVPKVLSGETLFGSREQTWAAMNAIANAVLRADGELAASLSDDYEDAGRTMALRRGMESFISVLYALMSTSYDAQNCPAAAYISLHPDYAYNNVTFEEDEETPFDPEDPVFSGGTTTHRKQMYLGAGYADEFAKVRRMRPEFAMKDDAGLQRARRYMQMLLNGYFDSTGKYRGGHKVRHARFEAARVKAEDFTFSLGNLAKFAKEILPPGVEASEADRKATAALFHDIKIVRYAIQGLAKAMYGEDFDADKFVIQPSTVLSQLIPIYAAMTERFGSSNSVVDLIPGVRERITSEQARLFSGALDYNAEAGFGFWDILAATAHAPMRRLSFKSTLATPVAARLTTDMISQVMHILDKAYKDDVANPLDNADLEKYAETVAGGEATAATHQAPEHRVMLDVLGPNETFLRVHEYVDDAMSNVRTAAESEPLPEATPVVDNDSVTKPDPKRDSHAREVRTALIAAIGRWADVQWKEGTDIITIKARGGLKRTKGTERFANGGQVDMVITVRLGSESLAGKLEGIDVNSPDVAASFCQAASRLGITPDQFLRSLSHAERLMLIQALTRGTSAESAEGNSFSLSLPSWTLTGEGLAILAGEIHLGRNPSKGTVYHELFHTMLGMFRVMDIFAEEDIAEFRKRYGEAPKGTGWLFNEEKAAEEFRKYVEKRVRGEMVEVEDDSKKGVHKIFSKLWEAIKSFLNAISGNMFSHSEPHSRSFLFDMMITGTAELSREKRTSIARQSGDEAGSISIERLADNEAFADKFVRLLEKSRAAKGAFVPMAEGATMEDVKKNAADRAKAAAERQFDDPFTGFVDQSKSTPTAKTPMVSKHGPLAAAQVWSNLLKEELERGRPRMSALTKILQGLIAVREGQSQVDYDSINVPVDPAADELSWRTVVNMDSVFPPETRAAVYRDYQVMGRAAARALAGTPTPEDLALMEGKAAKLSFVDKLAANRYYKAMLARHDGDASHGWLRRANEAAEEKDAVARTGAEMFLRMSNAETIDMSDIDYRTQTLYSAMEEMDTYRDMAKSLARMKEHIAHHESLAAARIVDRQFTDEEIEAMRAEVQSYEEALQGFDPAEAERVEKELAGMEAATRKSNAAYTLLVAAEPYIKSRIRAANRQKKDINAEGGAIRQRGEKYLSSANYAGFLMATGWKEPGDYLDNVLTRLSDLRQRALDTLGGQPSRISQVAEFLIGQLHRFNALDSASFVSDSKKWDDALNDFMREVMTGIKVDRETRLGRVEVTYANTKTKDEETVENPTEELRLRNQAMYGFGNGESSEDDATVNQMIFDAVTTMLAIRATARFARELDQTPGRIVDMPAAVNNPPQVDMVTLAEQFRLSTGNLVEGDEDIVDRHCQYSFVASNVERWFAASLPNVVGTVPLRNIFMKASAKLRGCISVQTNVENFLAAYLGVSRSEGNKLLRLVKKRGKFELGEGFYHRLTKEQEAEKDADGNPVHEYIGFDIYHGINGKTTGVTLTEEEYRIIDLFLKALAVMANGGRKFITGATGIRFNVMSKPMSRVDSYEQVTKYMAVMESSKNMESERPKAIDPCMYALARFVLQMPAALLDAGGGGYFMEVQNAVIEAVNTAQEAAKAKRVQSGEEMSDTEFNDIALGVLERRGVVVCEYDEDGHRVQGAFSVDASRIEEVFRGSTAFQKLTSEAGGRDPDFLKSEKLIEIYMKGYHDMRREVAKQPWLTSGDARFLNNFSTPLPFYQGTGNFMYHATRLVRDRKLSNAMRLAKHELTFLSMCSTLANQFKTIADVSPAMLEMLHDYFELDETGDDLLKSLLDGKYAKGTERSLRYGFDLNADSTYLDVARVIYLKQQERKLMDAEGRRISDIDDAESMTRMMQAYEGMTAAGGATLAATTGISDERMYQLHGVLPMNMQIGHKIHTAMRGIADSLYKRSCLVNMMFMKTMQGNPTYYINPSRYGVESGGIPDEVWGAMAQWWEKAYRRTLGNAAKESGKSATPEAEGALKYDPRLSGIENARAMYGAVSSLLQANGGKLGGRAYESMKRSDLLGQSSVEDVLCVKDDPMDDDTSSMNVVGGVGEALGYAKHLFMVDRVPGGGRLQWLDKVMAWSKSISVMGSAFFPIATKWESPTAAVGALATLGSNLSPEFIRRHHKAMNALTAAFGGGWVTEDFIGFRDIIQMMDSNDPFLADIIRWAEALGITMSTTLNNPMEPSKGYVARSIADMKERLRASGMSSTSASKVAGVLETMFLRQGEKAFTYALNATKLAVTCQIAMKLRHEAEKEGRAFDPIRDLEKYAAYIDTEIGGIDPLRYAWAHPQMQRMMGRVMFSWQWTRSAWEAGGGHFFEDLLFGGHTINKQTRQYIVGRWLRMYGTVMIGVPMMAQALIKALALACGRDDDDDKWWTFQNEDKTRWTAFDITPLMKVVHDHEKTARLISGGLGALYQGLRNGIPGAIIGGVAGAVGVPNYTGKDPANKATRNRRYYMHFGKQGWEFFRWFDQPVEQFFAKLSMPTQRALEGLLGRNPAYLERETKMGSVGIAKRFLTFDPETSAWVNFAKAFLPFTVNGITTFGDAGIASYFGPVQMGASQTKIIDRFKEALTRWAENDATARAMGQRMRSRRKAYVRREFFADIMRDAKLNGVRHPEFLLQRAVGMLVPRYYSKLMDLLPEKVTDKVDVKEIARTVRALLRLGATYQGAVASLDKKLESRGIDKSSLSPEQRKLMYGTLRMAFNKPFDY